MARRKSKSDFTATLQEPVPIASALEEVIEKAGLTTADQLEHPAPSLEQAAKRLGVWAHPDPEPELVLPEPSFVERLTQPSGLRPTPKGFRGMEGHYSAGIRLTRSDDKNVVGIQFSDEHKPSRDGLNPETERMRERGFLYVPMRTQWERVDREQPAANYQDAKELVFALVQDRLEGPDEGRGR
ncbi:hypothetical protein ACYOEI_06825 [Singulisphaera rosea]